MDAHRDSFDDRSTLRVVHALPGRLRFRGPANILSEKLAEAIRGLGGVRDCSWSARTGSILVTFEPEKITGEAIADALARHAGLDESPRAAPVSQLETRGSAGRANLAGGVVETFSALDRQVQSATRGLLRLGMLMPLALTLWATREILLGRAAPLAWSSALWYAHALFRDYNSPSAS